MLTSLRLKNFQTHRDAEFDIGYPVVVFCGPSDRGKSSVLRALRWACLNRPRGDYFISWGENECSVELGVDDRTVTRSRGSSNTYALDGQVFAAISTGVPDEIAALLNVDPEVAFQRQSDPPFWFSLSPGEVSKKFNAIVNLDLIDSSLSYLGSEVRKAEHEVESCSRRLTEALERRRELSWVLDADESLQEIEREQECITADRVRIASIESCLGSLRGAEEEIERLQRQVEDGQRVVSAAEEVQRLRLDAERLQVILRDQQDHEATAVALLKDVETAEQELQELLGAHCPLCGRGE